MKSQQERALVPGVSCLLVFCACDQLSAAWDLARSLHVYQVLSRALLDTGESAGKSHPCSKRRARMSYGSSDRVAGRQLAGRLEARDQPIGFFCTQGTDSQEVTSLPKVTF